MFATPFPDDPGKIWELQRGGAETRPERGDLRPAATLFELSMYPSWIKPFFERDVGSLH